MAYIIFIIGLREISKIRKGGGSMTLRFINKAIKLILPYGVILGVRYIKRAIFIKRTEAVAKLLSDKRSLEVYRGVVKARCGCGSCSDFSTNQVQYFENEYFLYDENEILIDCGAFTGDTIDAFIKFVPKFKGIISFEAMPTNFLILKKKYENNPKICLINKACYSGKVKKLHFIDYGGASRIARSGGDILVETTSIDALKLQEKVTFIKMDIEGAELEALKGAKDLILRDKPRLAISIYHSDDDMFRIVEYIHKIAPEYKLYVKQHELDTVLYCCI
jgi:FkbM family methyltransferase